MSGIKSPRDDSQHDPDVVAAIRRPVAPLGVELPAHPPVAAGKPVAFEWPSAEEKAAAVAQARGLKAQAAEAGLRFEAYLPPALATWLLGLVEDGSFLDPSEAVFVMLGEQRELEDCPDLRKELLRRTLQAAMDDPRPRLSAEDVRERLAARVSRPIPEPANWMSASKSYL